MNIGGRRNTNTHTNNVIQYGGWKYADRINNLLFRSWNRVWFEALNCSPVPFFFWYSESHLPLAVKSNGFLQFPWSNWRRNWYALRWTRNAQRTQWTIITQWNKSFLGVRLLLRCLKAVKTKKPQWTQYLWYRQLEQARQVDHRLMVSFLFPILHNIWYLSADVFHLFRFVFDLCCVYVLVQIQLDRSSFILIYIHTHMRLTLVRSVLILPVSFIGISTKYTDSSLLPSLWMALSFIFFESATLEERPIGQTRCGSNQRAFLCYRASINESNRRHNGNISAGIINF